MTWDDTDCRKINDLAFRRHIMVQALILMDFLLCQTPKAKRKFEALKNKSVIYAFTLDDENVSPRRQVRGAALTEAGSMGGTNEGRNCHILTARTRG